MMSTPLWWSLRITRKLMTLGLNREGAKQKYTYQSEFIDFNSSPVVVVNCDNRKNMGKEKWARTRIEKSGRKH